MLRRIRRALIPLIAVLLGVSLAGPASAATVIDVVDAVRIEDGAAVQVTVAVTCDPLPGADDHASLGVSVYQGRSRSARYIEGFASYGEIGGVGLICDGTSHTYSLTARPTRFYADRRFGPGPVRVDAFVNVCTLVAPASWWCETVSSTPEKFRL
jgi:hypothetical protein